MAAKSINNGLKIFTAILVLGASNSAVLAGPKIELSENISLEWGGRLVFQYKDEVTTDRDKVKESETEFYIRRLRPFIRLNYSDDWQFKLAWEIGKGQNNMKDAYIQYKGFDFASIKIGNETLPFSRERMISSLKQQTVERTLVGDTEFGVPGRQPGLHVTLELPYSFDLRVAVANAEIHGDLLTEIQFINPLNTTDIPSRLIDKGRINVARLDYRIFGGAKYRQGDLKYVQSKNDKHAIAMTLSAANYRWKNNSEIQEIEWVDGEEMAVAIQAFGFSIDAQHNEINAKSPYLLERPLFNQGFATIKSKSLEAGYMLVNKRLEVVASKQKMSALAWPNDWSIKDYGINYFLDGHDHKIQIGYRNQENIKGKIEKEKVVYFQYQVNF